MWDNWAKLALEIFPKNKERDTANEVNGIEKIFKKNTKLNNEKVKELSILDVCCGWGRHCFKFVEKGYQNVVGIDISKVFIEYAEEKKHLLKYITKPEFKRGDIFELEFDKKFDVVLNLWSSFGFYENDEKNKEMLRKIGSFLKPGGLFVIDIANRERLGMKLKVFSNENDYVQGNRHWWNGVNDILGLAEMDFNVEKSILRFHLIIFTKDGKKGESLIDLKIYTVSELYRFLQQECFNVETFYGDFNLHPYTFISPRLIMVCRLKQND